MTTNKPSAGAMKAANRIVEHCTAGLPMNEKYVATIIDEETGMPGLVAALEMIAMQAVAETGLWEAGVKFMQETALTALTKAKGEQS